MHLADKHSNPKSHLEAMDILLIMQNEVPVEVAETVVPFELTSLNTAAPTYDLVGVTQHLSNTLLGGHYTALCRSSADGCVYSCNDTKIAAAQFPSRPSSSPYLLMYRQKG